MYTTSDKIDNSQNPIVEPIKKTRKSRMIDGLTLKQRHFIKEYIKNGGNGSLAIQKSYPNMKHTVVDSYASKTLSKPAVITKLQQALDKAGLNDDYIAETLKNNIPQDAVGKGANATTINKTLELMIKLRERGSEGKVSSIDITMLQGIGNSSNEQLIDKRTKIQSYFTRILKD